MFEDEICLIDLMFVNVEFKSIFGVKFVCLEVVGVSVIGIVENCYVI